MASFASLRKAYARLSLFAILTPQPKALFWSLFLSQLSCKPHCWQVSEHFLVIPPLFPLSVLTCFPSGDICSEKR
jgi:hypothetical protein